MVCACVYVCMCVSVCVNESVCVCEGRCTTHVRVCVRVREGRCTNDECKAASTRGNRQTDRHRFTGRHRQRRTRTMYARTNARTHARLNSHRATYSKFGSDLEKTRNIPCLVLHCHCLACRASSFAAQPTAYRCLYPTVKFAAHKLPPSRLVMPGSACWRGGRGGRGGWGGRGGRRAIQLLPLLRRHSSRTAQTLSLFDPLLVFECFL